MLYASQKTRKDIQRILILSYAARASLCYTSPFSLNVEIRRGVP